MMANWTFEPNYYLLCLIFATCLIAKLLKAVSATSSKWVKDKKKTTTRDSKSFLAFDVLYTRLNQNLTLTAIPYINNILQLSFYIHDFKNDFCFLHHCFR